MFKVNETCRDIRLEGETCKSMTRSNVLNSGAAKRKSEKTVVCLFLCLPYFYLPTFLISHLSPLISLILFVAGRYFVLFYHLLGRMGKVIIASLIHGSALK